MCAYIVSNARLAFIDRYKCRYSMRTFTSDTFLNDIIVGEYNYVHIALFSNLRIKTYFHVCRLFSHIIRRIFQRQRIAIICQPFFFNLKPQTLFTVYDMCVCVYLHTFSNTNTLRCASEPSGGAITIKINCRRFIYTYVYAYVTIYTYLDTTVYRIATVVL